MKRLAAALLAIAPLSGCVSQSYLPADGPSTRAINRTTMTPSGGRVAVVELADASPYAMPLAPVSRPGLAAEPGGEGESLAGLGRTSYNATRLQPGDVIEVTIFDSGEQGLFSSTESRSLALGRFTVDPSGHVTMPFVGRQRVADSSPAALQAQIATALRGSAVNPQAAVTVVEKSSTLVTVDGSVRAPGRYPASDGRTRVLDVVALAGGTQGKPEDTAVTVERAGRRATLTLDRVLAERGQNVLVAPGDRVYLEADSPATSFTAFGAFKSTGEFAFKPGDLTLAEAIARAGGLLDDKADPLNLYLFRTPRQDSAALAASAGKAAAPVAPPEPVIIRVDMRNPANFLYMQGFRMMDDDVLFATNARSVNLAKYLTVLQKTPPLPAASAPGSN